MNFKRITMAQGFCQLSVNLTHVSRSPVGGGGGDLKGSNEPPLEVNNGEL